MDTISAYFAQQGILGIIILMLLGVVVWQQRRLDKKDQLLTDALEKRKLDTDAYTASYTAIVKENIAAQKDTTNATNLMQRSLDSLVTAVQAFVNK